MVISSQSQIGGAGRDFRHAAFTILLLAMLFFLNFLSRIIFSPLLPFIKEEFHLSHSSSGSLFFYVSTGYFISVMGSGFISSRINHSSVISLSSILAGMVLVILSFCTSFQMFTVSLFFLGLAAGIYLPSAMSTIFTTAPPAFLARGIAIHELAPNLGFVFAPIVWQVLGGYLTWRQCLTLLGLLVSLAGVLYFILNTSPKIKGIQPDFSLIKELFGNIRFWLLVLLFSLGICSTLGIYSMLPLFLVSGHAMAADKANYIISISRILSIFTPFLGGFLGDRFGNLRVMALILISGGLATIFVGLSSGALLVLMIVVQAMIAVSFFPSGFALLSSLEVGGKNNVAVPFCIPFAFVVGGGLLPIFIGSIGDVYSIGAGISCTGVIILAAGILTKLLELKKMVF